MDGNPIEPLISYGKEEVAPLKSSIPKSAELQKKVSPVYDATKHVTEASGILSSILKDLIQRGRTESWDNHLNCPTQRFVEVEGGDFKKTIKLFHLTSKEECIMYSTLRSEVPVKNEKEQIARDTLLKFVFPSC